MIKILFADDDLKYSMLLKSFLQQHGYDVTYAGNGKKAWEQFPEVKPDLVLLDINMPEMDGYEVAERIRAIEILKEGTKAIQERGLKEDGRSYIIVTLEK